jgi:DNA-binding transcriptional regulator YdaS (Cro superfamily)
MDIKAYFSETGETPSSLAAKIGRSVSTITRPLRGERNASMNVALQVERVTEGRVTADDFMSACLAAKKEVLRETGATA